MKYQHCGGSAVASPALSHACARDREGELRAAQHIHTYVFAAQKKQPKPGASLHRTIYRPPRHFPFYLRTPTAARTHAHPPPGTSWKSAGCRSRTRTISGLSPSTGRCSRGTWTRSSGSAGTRATSRLAPTGPSPSRGCVCVREREREQSIHGAACVLGGRREGGGMGGGGAKGKAVRRSRKRRRRWRRRWRPGEGRRSSRVICTDPRSRARASFSRCCSPRVTFGAVVYAGFSWSANI